MGGEAKAVYSVLAWTSAEGEAAFIEWLDGKHIREVVAEPGFLSGRRIALSQRDAEGWRGHLTLYELESRAALDAYLESAARAAFIEEGLAFDGVRMERLDGEVVYAATPAPPSP